MSFKVIYTVAFEKEFRKLSRKYPSLISEFRLFVTSLAEKPVQGVPLGNDCFKIRFPITSKGKGKRGGARIITFVKIVKELVFLVTIYDKSEKATISNKEIKDRLKPYL